MKANEIKVNLDLMSALIKMREASIIFEEQVNVIGEQAGMDYIEEKESFSDGLNLCMNAIGKMIGESVVNGVCCSIPGKAAT